MTELDAPQAVYRYWACDLRTGNKVAQLPLKPSGLLPDRIGDVSTASFDCDMGAVWRDGGDFIGTTTPGRTVIVVEREYEGDDTSDILWSGIILPRDAGSDPIGKLNCSTIPVYLNRRNAGSHAYNAGPGETDEKIITDLLADAAPEGIDLILDLDCPTLREVHYEARENRSVLACLKDLADMDGGPEWTIRTQWSDADRLSVDFVFVARTRLGWAGAPNIRFDFPGSIRDYVVHDDFTEGHGSNHLRAINSAGAASAPARDEVGLAQGYPRWEENINTSGKLNAAGLYGVAKGGLVKRARGQVTTDIEVYLSRGPQYLRDWGMGDNALWFVAGPKNPGGPRDQADSQPPSYRHPEGHEEDIRVIGTGLNVANDTVTLLLWSPYDEGAS